MSKLITWAVSGLVALIASVTSAVADEPKKLNTEYTQVLRICDTEEQVLVGIRENLRGSWDTGELKFDELSKRLNPATGKPFCSLTPEAVTFRIVRVVMVVQGLHRPDGTFQDLTIVEVVLEDESHHFAPCSAPVEEVSSEPA